MPTITVFAAREDAVGSRPAQRYEVGFENIRKLQRWVKSQALSHGVPVIPNYSFDQSIAAVIDLVIDALHGRMDLPPRGSVIGAGNSTVCDECPRARNIKTIKAFKRIQDIAPVDPALCILEQGVPCNGPATRSGCNARCPQAGAQCIGCYGPAEGVLDYGARLMTAFASVIDANTPEEINRILDGIPDPVGQVYRFNLAGSLLKAAQTSSRWARSL